jgi:hypothetical protein
MSSNLQVPSGVQFRLEQFRKRLWLVKLAEGAFAAAFGLAISYLAVFALDRVYDTPAVLRAALLIVGATGLGLFLPLKWHRWVWRQRELEQLARLLKGRFPRLSDQLLGVIELAHSDRDSNRSETLVRAAMEQVDVAIRDRDLTDAVPNPRHRLWAWVAGVPAVIVLAALIIVPGAGTNALARWLTPWRDVDRYTFARINELPDRIVVPYAEAFEVTATLANKAEWTPENASATYAQQAPVEAKLDGSSYRFDLPPQTETGSLEITVGDAAKSVRIEPTARPELTSLMAELELPAYLQRPGKHQRDVRSGTVTVVRGSRATFEATASRELATASVDGADQPVDGNRIRTRPLQATDSRDREFVWRDQLGLSAREPFVLKIRVKDDEAPTLMCQQLDDAQVLMEQDQLLFELNAEDDFGVRKVGLEWSGIEDRILNPEPARGEKVISAGGPDRTTVIASATFSPQREGVAPQVLHVRAWTEDYLDGRDRTYSPTYTLYVLNEEQHAIWLTNQFKQWFRKSQEVFATEQQLLDTNKQLRNLSADELDRPDTRKRITQQAKAERQNQQNLNDLTGAGRELIGMAAQNDQFNVAMLETWAEMLRSLQEISDQRMPSVADLLDQAADARGSQSGSLQPGDPQPANPQSGDSQSGGKPSSGQSSGKPSGGSPKSGDNQQPGSGDKGGDDATDSDDKPDDDKPDDEKPTNEKPTDDSDGKSSSQQAKTDGSEKSSGKSQDGKKDEAPSAGRNRNPQSGGDKAAGPKAGDQPPNKVPKIVDVETGFNPDKKDDEKKEEPKSDEPPPPAGSPQLKLPTTTLMGGPQQKTGEKDPSDKPPAEQKLDEAIEQQQDLIAEFEKIADELNRILENLEGSTFVKRLKAAARRQIEVATDLNRNRLQNFGASSDELTERDRELAARVVERETAHSEFVSNIQQDLDAYFNRVHDGKFYKVLKEMQDTLVVDKLKNVGVDVENNLNGRAIVKAEFLADALDRWAEQLVGPGCPSGGT